jgi:hypothetical protein
MAEDLNLPPNPTVADIEQEILFHHVVLTSMDPDDVCSNATKAEIEDKILHLNAMLAERNALTTAGRKRARVDSQSEDRQDAIRGVRPHGSSPRPESPDSSSDQDIEFLLSRPINRQSISRGIEQQLKIEKRLADQQEQLKRDARMAQEMASPTQPPAFGGHLVQARLNHNSQLVRSSSPFLDPSSQTPVRADGQNLVLRSPISRIPTNLQQPKPIQPVSHNHHITPQTMTLSSVTPFQVEAPIVEAKSESRNQMGLPLSQLQLQDQKRNFSSSQIGSVADSDSEDSIEEISASDFRPSARVVDRKMLPHVQNPNFTLQYSRSEPQLNAHNSLGNSYSTNMNQYVTNTTPHYLGSSGISSYQPSYPVSTMNASPYMPSPPNFSNLMNNLRGFGGAVSSSIGNAVNQFATSSNSYPAEYSYLYSDPTRNAEEIRQLLKNIRPDEDLPPELRKGTPPEMATSLLEHQKLGLSWLARQEEGTNKGGILADDMGLGKTIQAIALMVSRRAEDDRKTNLILAPVALLGQWQSEIEDKVKSRFKFNIFRYHGVKSTWDKLKTYDVVLTTYGTLGSEWKRYNERESQKLLFPDQDLPPLDLPLIGRDSKWFRIILDEAQNIKNKESNAAKGSFMLKSIYRLCMTGTPMMNNVTELYSLIRFCRIKPFDNWESE